MVTYEDMTSVQAARYPYWPTARLPRRAFDRLTVYQRAVYARAARCCTTTEWPAGSLVEDFGIDPRKVSVVGIGRNYQPPVRATRDFSLPRYLFVGRDWGRKNGPGLLAAFARVRERLPEAELALVGPAAAPEPPGVRLYGNLRFGRERDRQLMESLFDRATCFVLPSLCEPSGISYLEAMSAGLPVIVTAEGGSRHVVGDAGIVIDPHDIAGLAEAMLRLADPAIAGPMARAALERAVGLDWTAVTRRMLADL
jgi:glycosyltransferase involved in cell wall biosynthesis